MHNSFRAVCPGTRLEIVGYGLARPEEQSARVLVNGRRVTGTHGAVLERDLTNSSAVYRLVALCSQGENPSLQLQIYVGAADRSGRVSYAAATATFVRGALVTYRSFSPTNAEGYWFR